MATWLKRIVLAGGTGLVLMIAAGFGPTSGTLLDISAHAQQGGNVPGENDSVTGRRRLSS